MNMNKTIEELIKENEYLTKENERLEKEFFFYYQKYIDLV